LRSAKITEINFKSLTVYKKKGILKGNFGNIWNTISRGKIIEKRR
jgi:hypothetical protein